jgi:membrane protease YdiL (CAAX protease family)
MKKTFQEVFAFIKAPTLEKDANTDVSYRFKKFLHLLIISIITGFIFMPVFVIIEKIGLVNMDDHAMDDMMKKFSKPMILFLTAIIAPVFEELIFRGPITLFKTKKLFKYAFYIFTILFGLIHITNFTLTTNVILLIPFLVAPQLLVGAYFGYIRTKFNLGWSMLLHGAYNTFFMLIAFSADIF